MTRHLPGILIGVTASAALLCCAAPALVSTTALFGAGGATPALKPAACGGPAATPAAVPGRVAGFSAEQVGNAATIVRTGQGMRVPPRGWVIAVATAMQESTLHNYGHLGSRNDHDSQGLFQQRPSQGWGTPAQVRDPQYAARKFYERLLKVPGWQTMALTDAAQKVQRSGYPSAYAKHEDNAARLVDAISGGASRVAAKSTTAGACAKPDEVTASGWVRPVTAPVGSGFRTASRPGHDGVDLSTRRGVPIKAAAAGTVVHMECDTDDSPPYRCDRDGSPSTPGCGWYLDLRHAAGVITRYCHMLRRPLASTGDRVKAGQQIGVVGTSGHSSGPHLHFEVHLNGDRGESGAVDPVAFMRKRGAPLGGEAA